VGGLLQRENVLMFNKGIQAKEIYDRFRRGDPLPDAMLLVARDYWQDLAVKLIPLGETFTLASREANRVAMALEDFVSARKLTGAPEGT
jgi:hypothetical protein